MSSPLAKEHKTGMDRALIAAHQRVSHGHRVDALAQLFADQLRAVFGSSAEGPLRLLDVGCGDMSLADAIAARVPSAEFRCVDVHACPPELVAQDPRWKRYLHFDGTRLPFDANSFDAVLFSDVLHHVPEALRVGLLASAASVGRAVVIKDHLEYGWWSRQALRAMDVVGNFGYGVAIPQRYFRQADFERLCKQAGLQVQSMQIGVDLYGHLPLLRRALSPKWQFIAHCRAV